MAGLLISAAHKSSGKTVVSLGLCRALALRGLRVQPYKKGPDYIDPMWLGQAAGQPCYNLDLNMMQPEHIVQCYATRSASADLCVVEGNKGLYDGLALDGSNSNAALAMRLGLPVVLVLSTQGMTRGIAPLILGYQAFEPGLRIAGVILNQLGGARHEAKLRAVIEHYTNVPVLGAVARSEDLALMERHLGLVTSSEHPQAETFIAKAAQRMSEQIDLDRLLAVAETARLPDVALACASGRSVPPVVALATPIQKARRVRIAYARDEAFGFYYPDDLEALRAAGADLLPLDTLRDSALPAVDGLFLGGGFPEVFAPALEANVALRRHIAAAIEQGLPVYAECGGLMYLARRLRWNAQDWAMVGALPADVVMHARPVGRGYVTLECTDDHPWQCGEATAQERVWPGHEFHHSTLENVAPGARYAYRVRRGHGIDGQHDGLVHRNVLASYSHLRSIAGTAWAQRFVDFVRAHAMAQRPVEALA